MFSMRSHIILAPLGPADLRISPTTSKGPTAFSKLILLMAFLTIAVVIGSLGPFTGYTSDKPLGFHENSTLRRCICFLHAFFGTNVQKHLALFLIVLSPVTSWFSRCICLSSRYISTDLD